MLARLAPIALLLVAAAADAQKLAPSTPPSRKALRMGVLVIPLDRASESRVFELERQATAALKERGIPVAPAETIFGLSQARERSEKYELALQGFRAAKESFRDKDYAETLARMGPIVDAIRSEASSLSGPKVLCEAYALWAAAGYGVRNTTAAERGMRAHLALCPEDRVPETEFSRAMNALRGKLEQQAGPNHVLGNLELITRPPGARVFVDGEERGFTPLVVAGLRSGPHLVQVQRPGYETKGRVVEMSQERQGLRLTLRPSARQEQWEAERGELAKLVARNRSSDLFTRIGRTLGLGQGVFITVRSHIDSERVTVVLAHVRFYDGRILGHRRVTLQAHELPPVGHELSRQVSQLVVPADVIELDLPAGSTDPLDSVSGTEDW